LEGAGGGKKKVKQANKECGQLRTILCESGVACPYTVGNQKNLDKIDQLFVTKWMDENVVKATTIRNHLCSLSHFADYLFIKKISPKFTHEHYDRLQVVKKKWLETLRRQEKQETVERNVKDSSEMLTPETFHEFTKSEYNKRAKKIFENAASGEGFISKQQYTTARDVLLTLLSCYNALRPSAVTGITLDSLRKAQFFPGSKNYVCQVTDHKTSRDQGAANIGMSQELHEMMVVFRDFIRGKMPAEKRSKRLFLTWGGDALRSNSLPKIIKTSFKSTSFKYTVNNTKIRKMQSTLVTFFPLRCHWYL